MYSKVIFILFLFDSGIFYLTYQSYYIKCKETSSFWRLKSAFFITVPMRGLHGDIPPAQFCRNLLNEVLQSLKKNPLIGLIYSMLRTIWDRAFFHRIELVILHGKIANRASLSFVKSVLILDVSSAVYFDNVPRLEAVRSENT